jgi:hypothetical protein
MRSGDPDAYDSWTEAFINGTWKDCGDHTGECSLPATEFEAHIELQKSLDSYIRDWKTLGESHFAHKTTHWRIVWADENGDAIMTAETN